MDIIWVLIYFLFEYPLFAFIFFAAIIGLYLLLKGYKCDKCGTRTSEVQSTRYQDTTPTKKDGSRDKRYNLTGITWKTIKCKNEKCDNTWETV